MWRKDQEHQYPPLHFGNYSVNKRLIGENIVFYSMFKCKQEEVNDKTFVCFGKNDEEKEKVIE